MSPEELKKLLSNAVKHGINMGTTYGIAITQQPATKLIMENSINDDAIQFVVDGLIEINCN